MVAGGAEGSSEADLGAAFDGGEQGGVGDGDRANEDGESGEGVEEGERRADATAQGPN